MKRIRLSNTDVVEVELNSLNQIPIYRMSKALTFAQDKTLQKLMSTGFAGAVASFVTQPLQVIKTNRIDSPTVFYNDLHRKIISKGWKQYMRGSSLAVTRQAFGFTFYTGILNQLQKNIQNQYPKINKYLNYGFSSVFAKLTAMIFQAPLTLLKTRVQLVSSPSLLIQFKNIMASPWQEYTKGLGSSILRQSLYTLFHYSTYRYLKDSVFHDQLQSKATFVPAFVAGIVAITVSQPFEVLRSQISLNKIKDPLTIFLKNYVREQGFRGFFIGFLPRLVRICWSILQSFREKD